MNKPSRPTRDGKSQSEWARSLEVYSDALAAFVEVLEGECDEHCAKLAAAELELATARAVADRIERRLDARPMGGPPEAMTWWQTIATEARTEAAAWRERATVAESEAMQAKMLAEEWQRLFESERDRGNSQGKMSEVIMGLVMSQLASSRDDD